MDPSAFVDQASSKEKVIGNNRFQEEIHSLTEKLHKEREESNRKQNEIDAKNNEMIDLKTIIQKLKDEVSIQQKTHENMVSRLNHTIEGMHKSNKALQSEIENTKPQLNNFENEKSNMTNNIQQLENQLKEKSLQIDNLKQSHELFIKDNYNCLCKTNDELKEKILELENVNISNKELLSQFEKENNVLKEELNTLQSKNDELLQMMEISNGIVESTSRSLRSQVSSIRRKRY